MALLQAERIAGISTPLGPDVLVLESFSGTEELGRPFEFTVELRSEEPDISATDLIGKPVSVRLNTANEGKRYFHGHVSRFKKTNKDGIHQSYSATIVPWTWFLQQAMDCRIFQKKSIPDILQEVFKAHGFNDFELRLSGEHTAWEYCVQYRESDLNFIDRLAQQEGIYYYFRHEEQKHTMVLCDSPGAHEPFADYESVSFRPPGEHGEDDEHIREWISETRHRPGKYAQTDYDFTRPKTNLQTRAQITEPYAFPDLEVYDYPGEYDQASDGESWAKIRMEEFNSQVDVKSGWADARGLCVGSTFELTEILDTSAQGKYLVTATQITFDTGVYQTGVPGGGEVFRCQFSVIAADKTFRPERRTQKRLIQGLQTAVVTGPKGEEIYTDKHGRIKVQFHWDREGKFDENSSCWIRGAQIWAGKSWGGINIPRIGQEVVVAFLEGDPDQPLVIGSVYNGEQKPPYALPANKTQSGVKSRSSKGGSDANFNEIRFEDKMGGEEMYIHAEKDQNSVVENDQTLLVGHDKIDTIRHNESIVVENDQTLLVGRDKTDTIRRNKSIQVDGNHTEQIASAMTVNVGSTLTETVAVNYAETVGGAMELTVGGVLAITVGAAMAETVGGAKTESVGMLKSENVGGNRSLNVGGDKNETIAKNRIVSVTKDQKTTVGGQQKTSVTKESILNAKKVQIVAEEELQLKTGSANITLKKSGDILINGKKIEIKGSGDVVVKGSQIKEN